MENTILNVFALSAAYLVLLLVFTWFTQLMYKSKQKDCEHDFQMFRICCKCQLKQRKVE